MAAIYAQRGGDGVSPGFGMGVDALGVSDASPTSSLY